MPRFGRYEVTEEIYSSLDATVYRARAEKGGPEWVVKLFHPRGFPTAAPGEDPRIDLFLKAARVQQQAGEEEGVHAAPVLQIDVGPQGAWYVSPYYGSSVQRLVEHCVHLDAECFYRLVVSIHHGLVAFQARQGRCHGNLKPGNILLAAGDLLTTAVALSDPAPNATEAHEREDLRRLGEIIYQLVRAAPVRAREHWPALAPEKDWKAVFGEQAGRWRELCHDLLAPDLSLADINLEGLGSRLQELVPTVPWPRRAARALVRTAPITVSVGLLLAGLIWLRSVPNTDSPAWQQDLARWTGSKRVYPREWQASQEATGWLPQLLDKANQPSPLWTNDTHLRIHIVERLQKAGAAAKFSPPTHAPDAHKARSAIRNHVQLAEEVRTDLLQWSRRLEVAQGALLLAQRGWKGPAAQLKSCADGLHFERQSNLPEAIDKVLNHSAFLQSIEAQWNKIHDESTNRLVPLATLREHFQISLAGATHLSELESQVAEKLKFILEVSQFLQTDWTQLQSQWKQLATEAQNDLSPPLRWTGNFRDEFSEWKRKVQDKLRYLVDKGFSPPSPGNSLDFYLRYRILQSETVNAEWLKRRSNLVNDQFARENLLVFLAGVHQFLTNLAAYLPSADLDANGIQTGFYQALLTEAMNRREAALQQALARIPWDVDRPQVPFAEFQQMPEIAGLPAQYAASRDRLARFGREATELPARLARAEGLPGWQNFSDLEMYPVFKAVFDPLRELENVRTNSALRPEELERKARAANAPLAIAWAAWRRLHAAPPDWLTNLANILTQDEIDKTLRARVMRIGDEHRQRREEMAREMGTNGLALLMSSFVVLPDDSSISRARAALERSSLLDGIPLPTEAQYNLLLHQLRTADLSKLKPDQLALQRSNFLYVARTLSPSPLDESTRNDLVALDFAGGPMHQEIVPGLEKLKEKRSRWTEIPGPDPARASYVWKTGSGFEHRLEFVRLDPPGAAPFYLGTTEVPVGLVIDWMGAWPTDLPEKAELTNALPILARRLARASPGRGIHPWELVSSGLRLAGQWQEAGKEGWPEGTPLEFTKVAPPTKLTPMNYLSPEAARLLARWLGFRLPKTNEWLAAYATDATGPRNLRDKAFEKQKEWVRTHWSKTAAGPPWPDHDVFVPSGLKEPTGENAAIHKDLDDGWLWFEPVSARAGSQWLHLIGNVAEYLHERGADEREGTFFIIGGSALSDPAIELARPYPLVLTPREQLRVKNGFADVGFRLAHEAELSPVQKFKWLALKQPYVTWTPPRG